MVTLVYAQDVRQVKHVSGVGRVWGDPAYLHPDGTWTFTWCADERIPPWLIEGASQGEGIERRP